MAHTEPGPSSSYDRGTVNKPSSSRNPPIGEQKRREEPDTCRICRGEGSEEEPLYYPCKCSGSIKFVHQGCLMEWLSHSQKKHCELCKTPFRFTKFYDETMPKIVPMPIFLRQAALHTLKSVLTWVRWNVVIFVWLGWVPWCMRTVWRALFWIGDGGWVNLEDLQAQSSRTGQEHLSALAADGTLTMTDLIVHKNLTVSQIIVKVTNGMPRIWWSGSQSTNSTSQPAVFRFAKGLFEIVFHRPVNGVSGDSFNSHNNTTNSSWSGTASSSLLSDVGFLRTLTPWPVMNKLIIDVLEGQLITLLVVVAFILIFLIREWVVQQQPALNMGEARDVLNRFDVEMNDAFNRVAVADGQQAGDLGLPIADQPPAPGPQANRVDDRRFAIPRARGGRPRRAGPVREEWQRYIREQQDLDIQEDVAQPAEDGSPITDRFEEDPTTNQASSPRLVLSRHSSAGLSTPHSRPGLPSRDGLSRATEIQRNLEESPGWPGLDVFKDLWTRADGNPSEVLKIIQEEGREAELEWVVTAMKRFEQQVRTSTFDEIPEASSRSIRTNEGSTPGNEYPEQGRNPPNEREQDTHDPAETNVGTAPVASEGIPTGIVYVQKEYRTGIQTGILDSDTLIDEESFQTAHNGRSGTIDSQPALQHSTETNIPENDDKTPEAKASVSEGKDDQSESQDSTSAATGIILTPTSDSLSVEGANKQEHGGPAGNEALVHALPAVNNEESFQETVFNWLWGDALQQDHQHEHADEGIVEGDVDEEPIIPVIEDEPATPNDDPIEDDVVPDAQIAEAAAEAGADPIDAEAVEDGEDLEGVMELIGMQGPIAGLLQNGMFCAVLISVTVFCGVWMPYIAGKVLLVLLANPVSLFVKLPLRWASTIADIIIDTSILIGGCVVYWIDSLLRFAATPVGWILPFFATINDNKVLTNAAWNQANTAGDRLLKMFVTTSESFSDSDIPVFSIIAHESLTRAESFVADFAMGMMTLGSVVFNGQGVNKLDWFYYVWDDSAQFLFMSISYIVHSTALWVRRIWYMLPALLTVNPLRITLDIPHRLEPLDYSLAIWSTRDRVLTIVLGYIAFALIGTSYIKICVVLQDNSHSQRARGVVADVLYQAAGVLKVVLIISIEMLVFPLYCGMLLDAALLPLFENATAASRINFTLTSPLTSLFVHWFVGTCYMFHFALFVSMCRKIMRNGVLYFIRDPDDPTFHPVRDVLERNVATQLRKIAFSALIYGALVIVCLGSVVWGLYFAVDDIFPIHWSSNEPVLEFPVDLLVYNFLMPLALKFFRPSKGLTEMYEWWFRKCARLLRLSHFMFGEQKADEEGHRTKPIWTKLVHGTTPEDVKPIANKTSLDAADDKDMETNAETAPTTVGIIPDGRYVRAPASDQVRIPKGATTFVEVDKDGNRKDGKPDTIDGLHGSKNNHFTVVYVPPHFRFRIALFIVMIWLFAAATGVTFTIIPLIVGRRVFAYLIPSHLRMNDIYAFSIGIYLLGGPLYVLLSYSKPLTTFTNTLIRRVQARPELFILSVIRQTLQIFLRVLRLGYFYTSFTILLPSIFALLMETYVVIPLHTYFSPTASSAHHTIHFVQDWTLGVLYLKMATRLILYRPHTRPATALRAIIAAPYGWLNPDIRLATRAAILPGTIFGICALLAPLGVGAIINLTVLRPQNEFLKMRVYRYTYPAIAAMMLVVWGVVKVREGLKLWRRRIRDEVYLKGERLHNFGERRRRKMVDKGKMREGTVR